MELAIIDDKGAAAGRNAAGHDRRSLGLLHVRERMERLGGRFQIDSAPGSSGGSGVGAEVGW